jgi:hypothetical protein
LATLKFGTAAAFTTVGSEARSFEGSLSPGVLTLAEFVTLGTAAPPTEAVIVNGELALAAIGPGRVAVTIWPFTLKLHPLPLPDT